MCTGLSNLSCTTVPPEKSIPILAALRATCTTPVIPSRAMIADMMKETFLIPMKSIFVLPIISIIPPLYAESLYPYATEEDVEYHLGRKERGKEIDDDTEA